MNEYEEAVLLTFGLLESRLDRLEYVLGGPHKQNEDRPQTIPDRIRRIEQALQKLAGKTSLLDDAHELLSKHQDILKPQPETEYDGPSLDATQKAALVVERATGFATTASQLKALDDQQLPTTDGFAKLAMLRPRIAEAEKCQLEQALKISELRRRNGLVNQRYKQTLFLGAGRCWVDYHERLTKALQTVVREEFRRMPDEETESDESEESEEL